MKARLFKPICITVVAAAVAALSLPVPAGPGGGGDIDAGRLSPASLDLDTCSCPTWFTEPTCEERTYWSLTKTAGQDVLDNGGDFSFTVTVTEGETKNMLTGGGQIIVTNSGETTPSLSSVVVSLEKYHSGGQNPCRAPGPSGSSWTVIGTAVENEFPACVGTAPTCYGDLPEDCNDNVGNLVLYCCEGGQLWNPATEELEPCGPGNDVIALSDRVQVPPTLDNDGDGYRDEDPFLADPLPNPNANSCSVHDNDGDGLYDEDPTDGIDNDGDGGFACSDGIDNDGDGLIDCDDPDECGANCDEDGPDDDGDGFVDEDGACEDAVIFCFEYEFDVTGLDIAGNGIAGDNIGDLRINLMVTFDSGGKRGGTCSVDVDCDDTNGVEKYVRTVQQRHVFDLGPEPCLLVCECVTLNDSGATSNDENCVTVVSNSITDAMICATGTAGTTTDFSINGTAFCQGNACSAIISNIAELTCEDPSLISGSPASAEIIVNCTEGGGGCDPLPDGAFCTQTQGGWGQDKCNPQSTTCDEVDCSVTDDPKGNVACFRDCWFDTLFPDGLIVGDPDGPDADGCYAILLTSSEAVAEYLPAGGTPAALSADQTDPKTTASGVFGGQLVAATLNLAVDDAGLRRRNCEGGVDFDLGDLVYVACVDDGLIGWTVHEVVALANDVISGCADPPGDVSISEISDALAFFNESFVDCDGTSECFNYSEECECLVEFPEDGNVYIGYEDWINGDFDYNDFGMNFAVQEVYVGTSCTGDLDLKEVHMTFKAVIFDSGMRHLIHIARPFNGSYTYDVVRPTVPTYPNVLTLWDGSTGQETPAGNYSGSGELDVVLFNTEKYSWPQKQINEIVEVRVYLDDPASNPKQTLSPPRDYDGEGGPFYDLPGLMANYDPWEEGTLYQSRYHIEDTQVIANTGNQRPFSWGTIIPVGTEVPMILVVPTTDWIPPYEDTTITGPYDFFTSFYTTASPADWYLTLDPNAPRPGQGGFSWWP